MSGFKDERVYLDGALVDPSAVDPARHRFLGTFRPPTNPADEMVRKWANEPWDKRHPVIFMCACGASLEYNVDNDTHYRRGCFDRPQYVSIASEQTNP